MTDEELKRLQALRASLHEIHVEAFGGTLASGVINTVVHQPFSEIRFATLFLSFHDNSRAVICTHDRELVVCPQLSDWATENNGRFELLGSMGALFVENPA